MIAPTARLHTAWLEAHREWGPGRHEDGFGLRPSDEVKSPAGFADWVPRLAGEEDPAKPNDRSSPPARAQPPRHTAYAPARAARSCGAVCSGTLGFTPSPVPNSRPARRLTRG